MPFLKRGRHLWTHFSQSFSDKNEGFLCSSERKFPELFKTHPTFVYSLLLVPSVACFFRHPVHGSMSGGQRNLGLTIVPLGLFWVSYLFGQGVRDKGVLTRGH